MSNSWKFALKKIIAEQLREGAYALKKIKMRKKGKISAKVVAEPKFFPIFA